MALPSTQAGITQMQNLTSKETLMTDAGSGGCAFACHQASTNNSDSAGNPCTDGTSPTTSGTSPSGKTVTNAYCASKHGAQIDNYALARKNNITLRLDELNSGVSTLLQTASATAQSTVFATPPKYRFAIYSMDSAVVDRPQPADGLDLQLYLRLDERIRQFRRDGDVFEQQPCARPRPARRAARESPAGDVATDYDNSLRHAQPDQLHPQPRQRHQPERRYAAGSAVHRHRRR